MKVLLLCDGHAAKCATAAFNTGRFAQQIRFPRKRNTASEAAMGTENSRRINLNDVQFQEAP
ncbi:hypothetical protein [Variovorax sp. W2I14]|uniref:hypothetical protein n=1 Tax=Variovorax sp. W2I14 TaxID=3042290 RepID=UPI003D24B92B